MQILPTLGFVSALTAGCNIDNNLAYHRGKDEPSASDSGVVHQDIPTLPFQNAISSCLGLDKSACPIDYDERGPESSCSERAIEERQALENQLLASAKEATGNDSLTWNDIINGEVTPATVYGYFFLGESTYKGEDITEKTAHLQFSFGDHSAAYTEETSPADDRPFETLRCSATAYSYDLDSPFDEVVFDNTETGNYFFQADEETATLNLADFTSSIMAMSNGYSADDPEFDFTTTRTALDSVSKATFDTASALARIDEGTNAEVYVY